MWPFASAPKFPEGVWYDVPMCIPTWSGLRGGYEFASLTDFVVPAVIIFTVTTLMRLGTAKLLLIPLANVASKDVKDRRKFVEAAWRAILYAAACIFAVRCIFFGNDEMLWLNDSVHFWKGYPFEPTDNIRMLYALYTGFYVHQLIFLFLDTKSSDFAALLLHHCVTLTIVVLSWTVKQTRIGAFTMVLHDFSDVFLEIAKCFNYSQKSHPKLSVGADVAFVVFAISFFFLRLYIYPTRVLHSAVVHSCPYSGCIGARAPDGTWGELIPPTLANCWSAPAFLAFIPALAVLQGLQIFWGWKVLGVIATVIRGKALEDPRED